MSWTKEDEYKSFTGYHGKASDAGFDTEDKKLLLDRITNYPIEKPLYEHYVDWKNVADGARTFFWQARVKATQNEDIYKPLVEGIGTSALKTEEKEQSISLNIYGANAPYTEEAILFNYNNKLDDIELEGRRYLQELPENLIAGEIAKADTVITKGSKGVLGVLRDAKLIFGQKKVRPLADGYYHVITTPEVISIVAEELDAKGNALSETCRIKLEDGAGVGPESGHVGFVYGGFKIIQDTNDALYKDVTTGSGQSAVTTKCSKMVFIGRDELGRNGLVGVKDGKYARDNGLGSGVVKDASGNVVSDTNGRVGSVAFGYKKLAVGTRDTSTRLLCIVDPTASKPTTSTAETADKPTSLDVANSKRSAPLA